MDLLPLAMSLSQHAVRKQLHSALPAAPVVPDRTPRPRPQRAVRSRRALARLLEGAAQRVAPAPACSPQR
jgi:hypothetical protein